MKRDKEIPLYIQDNRPSAGRFPPPSCFQLFTVRKRDRVDPDGPSPPVYVHGKRLSRLLLEASDVFSGTIWVGNVKTQNQGVRGTFDWGSFETTSRSPLGRGRRPHEDEAPGSSQSVCDRLVGRSFAATTGASVGALWFCVSTQTAHTQKKQKTCCQGTAVTFDLSRRFVLISGSVNIGRPPPRRG